LFFFLFVDVRYPGVICVVTGPWSGRSDAVADLTGR
jgi:hypothetical protein